MDFKEFWNKLSVELRHAREFSTLTQQKIFEVQMASARYPVVRQLFGYVSRTQPKDTSNKIVSCTTMPSQIIPTAKLACANSAE